MPEISVVVPVYNSESFLSRCINSILCQSFRDFEVFLIDDGSTDNSGLICDRYKEIDNRIHVFHQINQGQAVARNVALDMIKERDVSEWIIFVDSDDYVHPRMFECLIRNSYSLDSDILIFDYVEGYDTDYKWSQIDNKYHKYTGKEFLRKSLLNNTKGCWILCDKMFRTKCFDDIRLPCGRAYEDNAIVYKILYDTKAISVTTDVFYYYYTNNNSTTHQQSPERLLDWVIVLEEMFNFFEEKKEFEVSDFLIMRFFDDLIFFVYEPLKKQDSNSVLLQQLKFKIKYYFKLKKKKLGLNIKNAPEIYSVLYPKISSMYKWLKSL